MDAALKELDKLEKLSSDAPSTGKNKTPPIQESLESLLHTLHVQKKRLEAGLSDEAELATLARTVEARKKEIDERQKEIYNSLARYGKALDKVSSIFRCLRYELMGWWNRGFQPRCQHMTLSFHPKMLRLH
jgi:E3 ubiquitin-protein transferase RMND5